MIFENWWWLIVGLTEAAARVGQWASSERPSQSSSNNRRGSFSSFSSSQSVFISLSIILLFVRLQTLELKWGLLVISNRPSGQRNQSFMEMIKSAKGSSREEEVEEEEQFVLKKETSTANTTQRGVFIFYVNMIFEVLLVNVEALVFSSFSIFAFFLLNKMEPNSCSF